MPELGCDGCTSVRPTALSHFVDPSERHHTTNAKRLLSNQESNLLHLRFNSANLLLGVSCFGRRDGSHRFAADARETLFAAVVQIAVPNAGRLVGLRAQGHDLA